MKQMASVVLALVSAQIAGLSIEQFSGPDAPRRSGSMPKIAHAGNSVVSGVLSGDSPAPAMHASSKVISREIVRALNERLTSRCVPSENPSIESRKAHLGTMSPEVLVVGMLRSRHGIKVAGQVKSVVIRQPAHGKIDTIGFATRSFPGLSLEVFQYTPDAGFLGKDNAVVEVAVDGTSFQVNYVIMVVHGGVQRCMYDSGRGQGLIA
jgi:hypothetical protein